MLYPDCSTCAEDGCDLTAKVRGYCRPHYYRLWKRSGPLPRKSVADRLWSGLDQSGGPDACWPWRGTRTPAGYGTIRVHGKTVLVHRLAWEETNGPIPPDMMVCHRCDNPPCGNPTCLFLGTSADNMADRDRKMRTARGNRSGTAKITEADIPTIRKAIADGEKPTAIGRRFGVGRLTIWRIARRISWAHVD